MNDPLLSESELSAIIEAGKLGLAHDVMQTANTILQKSKSGEEALRRIISGHATYLRALFDILDANRDAILCMIPEKDRDQFKKMHDASSLSMMVAICIAGMTSPGEGERFRKNFENIKAKAELSEKAPAGTA